MSIIVRRGICFTCATRCAREDAGPGVRSSRSDPSASPPSYNLAPSEGNSNSLGVMRSLPTPPSDMAKPHVFIPIAGISQLDIASD